MICEYCDEEKPDVEMRPDPYSQDVYNDPTEHLICDSCATQRAEDV